MTPRRFAIGLLLGTALAIGAVGVVNRVVDPFWYYRDTEIAGVNAVKTKFRRFERHVKPAILARERPQAVAIGSSFAEIGLDPLNPDLTDGGRLKGYNFALAGTNWSANLCHFEYALRATDLRRVVAGIHPGDLPDVDCKRDLEILGSIDRGALLFSAKALKASIDTVREQGRERPSHTPEGLYHYTRDDAGADRRFREYFALRFRADAGCREGLARGLENATPGTPQPREPDLSGLRRMVRLASEKGVELRLVFYPRHAYSLELDFVCGVDAGQWQAMGRIAAAVEEEARARGGNAQVWEFFDWDAVTAEPVTAGIMRYWQDPEHFNSEVGDLMLRDMFGAGPPAFGRRVTPEGIAAARDRFLDRRQVFLGTGPGFRAGLAALLSGGS